MSNDLDDKATRSIGELVDAYKTKKLSPVDVVKQQLQRIDKFGQSINAFVYVVPDKALASARESEARYAAGRPIGPLDGVTFSAKDGLSVTGYPSRRGSKATPDTPATVTSPTVERCLAAGGIYIGSTTMPEFGIGPLTTSPLTGTTYNPWDVTKHAGGSSGGAAAAVAAGFNTFSLGTDAGGSNRIPAAMTGTVGYKGSGGRVPAFPPSGAGGLSCPGPIAGSVRDVAKIMNVIAKYDPRDVNALPSEDVDYESELSKDIKGLRVAYSATLGFAKLVHPEIEKAARAAALRLRDLGATIQDANPEIEDPVGWYVSLMQAGNQYTLRKLTEVQKEVLSPNIRRLVDGPPVAIQSYLEAQERARALTQAMVKFHERFDILVTPAVAAPAFDASRVCPPEYDQFENKRAWCPFVSLFNLTQQPAISIPIGLTGGLPIGLQLAAPRFGDALLMRVAHALEQKLGFREKPQLNEIAVRR